MMKKLLLLCVFIGAIQFAQAQCTPNPALTQAGIYPDTITNLPLAAATSPYLAQIDAVIPNDTVIDYMGNMVSVSIDSIGVTGVDGLPAGFSYATNTASGFWQGGTSGCLIIQGNPTQAQVGIYKLDIFITSYGNISGFSIPGQKDTLSAYRIDIRDSSEVSIYSIEKENFSVSQNYPNPFSKQTEITINSPKNTTAELVVYDVIGNRISTSIHNVKRGENAITYHADNLVQGIYIYQVKIENQLITKRMIVGR
jgi:hypothetical protein